MWMTRVAINHPVFATMVMVALTVLGIFSYQRLRVEAMPDVRPPFVFVRVDYPGASPEQVGALWARLVELLGGLPSVVLGFLGILVLSPYLRQILDLPTGLTALAGSLLLGGIAVLPYLISMTGLIRDATNFSILSTGLLIVVGVVLDTVRQLEAQLTMRHYEGFIK